MIQKYGSVVSGMMIMMMMVMMIVWNARAMSGCSASTKEVDIVEIIHIICINVSMLHPFFLRWKASSSFLLPLLHQWYHQFVSPNVIVTRRKERRCAESSCWSAPWGELNSNLKKMSTFMDAMNHHFQSHIVFQLQEMSSGHSSLSSLSSFPV